MAPVCHSLQEYWGRNPRINGNNASLDYLCYCWRNCAIVEVVEDGRNHVNNQPLKKICSKQGPSLFGWRFVWNKDPPCLVKTTSFSESKEFLSILHDYRLHMHSIAKSTHSRLRKLESSSSSPNRQYHQTPWWSSNVSASAIFSCSSLLARFHRDVTDGLWRIFGSMLSRCVRASVQIYATIDQENSKLFN